MTDPEIKQHVHAIQHPDFPDAVITCIFYTSSPLDFEDAPEVGSAIIKYCARRNPRFFGILVESSQGREDKQGYYMPDPDDTERINRALKYRRLTNPVTLTSFLISVQIT